MAKKHSFRQAVTVRESTPKYRETGKGVEVLCPFCNPSHPIYPDKDAACGTLLKVTAMQTVVSSRMTKREGLLCLRCGSGGGEMAKFGNGFVHINNCNPGRRMLANPPTYSDWARRVYNMPESLRGVIEKFTGKTQMVYEVDQNGQETGVIAGYFFLERK